jgi:hypothetical protein
MSSNEVWLRSNYTREQKTYEERINMNKCIKRTSGGVMRISDYWLLEVVQQSKWILQETDSNHTQNIRAKKILERVRRFLTQVGRGKDFREKLIEEKNRGTLPL